MVKLFKITKQILDVFFVLFRIPLQKYIIKKVYISQINKKIYKQIKTTITTLTNIKLK